MKSKTLIFLCDSYPLAKGEFFVDDEMRVLASHYEKIFVLTATEESNPELQRYIPENMIVERFSRPAMEQGLWRSLWRLFSPMVLRELFFAIRLLPMRQWFIAFKILFVEIHRAHRLKNHIYARLKDNNLNISDCIFYSYWHDYKALSLALLRKDYLLSVCIARAHRWDVFADKNDPPYLPFKRFIVEHLSKTVSISQAGKDYFELYLRDSFANKSIVSRLGKFNTRIPLIEKTNKNAFLICSCSNLIPVKRVDKIIDVLTRLQMPNIHWIHFGDGPLRTQLKEKANTTLPHVAFEFKGVVSNEKILEFYAKRYVDLFINLSDSEGIPVSIMEALSAGIPVIATNVGGTAEAVNENNGFLVETNTAITEISKLIERFLQSDSTAIIVKRQSSYQSWQENYDAAKNYADFLSILKAE